MKLKKKAAILDFSKFQKGGHLGFFQIVFGSKNVAKQSCRSMKFQKGGHLGFFQIDYWTARRLLDGCYMAAGRLLDGC